MINATHVKLTTPGPGYFATSATSVTIAGSGSIAMTTQSGLAYTPGARVRVTNTADTSKWMEGIVSSYAGTTLTFTSDKSNGSGTFASWNVNVAGQPGAATTVAVGTTTTGAAGSSASVSNSGTAFAAVLDFTVPQGAQGIPGSAVNPRGPYASGTTYAQFDGVTDAGVSYISLQAANTGHTPASSPTWWQSVGTAGLSDPGSNGIVKRTAVNTTGPALASDLSAPVYAAGAGTNAITATLSPAIASYADGTRYRVKTAASNTAAVTLNLCGVGALPVYKWVGGSLVDLAAGDLAAAGQMMDVTYDASNSCFQLLALGATSVAGSVRFRAFAASGATQAIASGTWTKITCGTVTYNVGGAYSTGTNLFTAPSTGGYHVCVTLTVQTNGSGQRYLAVWKNNSNTLPANPPHFLIQIAAQPASGYLTVTSGGIIQLTAGDTLQMMAYQDGGVSQSTFAQDGNIVFQAHQLW